MPLFWECRNLGQPLLFLGLIFVQSMVIYFLTLLAFIFSQLAARRRYLAWLLRQEHAGRFPPPAYEYRSRANLFGWPLLHVRLGDRFDVMRGPVKAWIAIGSSHAVGLLFASGGVAVAPVCLGGVAIGLLPFGAIALGVFPIGALSVGIWAYGALAVGWQVFSGCGFAWSAASGAVAVAHDYAVGRVAFAAQANTRAAQFVMQKSWYYNCAQVVASHGLLLMLGWVLPMIWKARIVERARRRRESSTGTR